MTPGVRELRLEQLDVVDVRSFARATVQPGAGLTVFVGPNGAGKTNLLEACAVALTGSSPRTSSETRLVREGCDAARMHARISIDGVIGTQEVRIVPGRGKQLLADDSSVRGIEAYGARTPALSFLPERLLVIRGAPARRRALVDSLAARLDPTAAPALRDYTRALQQRNTLLRRAKAGRDVDAALVPWTDLLIEHGAVIRAVRASTLARLHAPFAQRLAELTDLPEGEFVVQPRGEGELAAAFEASADADRRRGSTTTGPHLDDIVPLQAGRDIRAFGSTGEQRAVLLAFTLAAADLVCSATGTRPVLLLDEPWSELDADRRRRLSDALLDAGQVVTTTTEPPAHLLAARDAGADVELRRISSGSIHPWLTDAPDMDSPTSPT